MSDIVDRLNRILIGSEERELDETECRAISDAIAVIQRQYHSEIEAHWYRKAWERECCRRISVCYGRKGTASVQDCITSSRDIVEREVNKMKQLPCTRQHETREPKHDAGAPGDET